MANKIRAKATLREKESLQSREELEIAYRKLLGAFRNACKDAGVLHTIKMCRHYESPGRKKRRKLRESEVARLKAKLKENFSR